MARRFWRQRTLIIGAAIVVLSVGIVFASIPYLPHSHNSITSPQSFAVNPGNSTYPGYHALLLPSISNGESLAIGVTVTGGAANFCVIPDAPYENWALIGQHGWASFPQNDCILQQQTAQGTLAFTATSQGTWDVAALNTNPTAITVRFSPA
jgi:hypothetical protein